MRARRRWAFASISALPAVALVALVTGCSSGAQGASPASSTDLALDTPHAGRVIPAGYLGLGIEYRALANYSGSDPSAPDPVLARLISNLSPGQPPVLRIGGDTTDWTWWPVPGMQQPPWVHYSLTPRWVAVTRALTRRLGARLILGINFEADNTEIAASEADALVNGIGAQSIEALELGNEPELYHSFGWYRGQNGQAVPGRPADYDFDMFQREFTALSASLPSLPIAGPTTGGPWWEPDWPRFLAAQRKVRLATVHRYPLHACSRRQSPIYPTVSHLLEPLASRGLAADTRQLVGLAHARGIPLRVDEMNPTPCPTRALELRSFAGALWAVDILFEMASIGVDGVNFQSSTGATEDLFSVRRGAGGWSAAVKPEYYGMLLFAQAAPPGSRLIPLSGRQAPQVHTWATKGTDGTVRVVLINQGGANQVVSLRSSAGAGAATVERLEAPDLEAQQGITLGGRSFGSWTTTGRLAGNGSVDVVKPSQGRFTVSLPRRARRSSQSLSFANTRVFSGRVVVPGHSSSGAAPAIPPRAGQVVLEASAEAAAPAEQIRALDRLNDPALSELGLEEFLNELLLRVREALSVDTVAILLYDQDADQLVARAAKGIEEEVEAGVRIPVGRGFAGRIAADRVAIFIADVDHADIMNPILREKGIQSLLGVPLIVDGNLIGVLHVGSLTPRGFGATDLAVLQFAAARAGPGIERARLYSALEHEHRAAMILQRSLLPKALVSGPGVETAARYMPAGHEVGGDWYDVFQLPHGQFGIVIGDVVGHGLRAAALMGQLRTALHAYAVQPQPPARTLELVDRFMHGLPEPAMATAAYAVLDPASGALRVASAGHLPPIVVGGDNPRVIGLASAPPLGAFPYAQWQEQDATLKPGETIVFYTDGLVERRGIPLMEGISSFLDAVGDASSAEEACLRAVEYLIPAEPLRDDVAIVAVSYGGTPADLKLHLSADPNVLSDIRLTLRIWLHSQEVEDSDAREILLAINEACTNAIEHAYSPGPAEFELAARRQDDELVFTVSDSGTWRNPRGGNRGRGLAVIEAAMDDLQIDSGEGGTVVVMRRRRRP